MSSNVFQLQPASAADASPGGSLAIHPRDAQKHCVIPAKAGIHLFWPGAFDTEMDSRLRGNDTVEGARQQEKSRTKASSMVPA